MAKTINLNKTLGLFVFLGYNFSVKLLQITWSFKKCRRMDSLNIISYLSVAQNASSFLIHWKKATKEKVRLQLIVLHEETQAHFKTSTFLAVLSWSLLKPFGLQKEAIVISLQAIRANYRPIWCCNCYAQLVSMMHSAKQGNYLKQPFIASQTLSYTVILS